MIVFGIQTLLIRLGLWLSFWQTFKEKNLLKKPKFFNHCPYAMPLQHDQISVRLQQLQ